MREPTVALLYTANMNIKDTYCTKRQDESALVLLIIYIILILLLTLIYTKYLLLPFCVKVQYAQNYRAVLLSTITITIHICRKTSPSLPGHHSSPIDDLPESTYKATSLCTSSKLPVSSSILSPYNLTSLNEDITKSLIYF